MSKVIAYAWVYGQHRGLSFTKPDDIPEGAELHELHSIDTQSTDEPVALLMEADGRKPIPVMLTDEKSITFYATNGYVSTPLKRC